MPSNFEHKLTPEQKTRMRELVLEQRLTDKAIAKEIGCSHQTVARLRKKEGIIKGVRGTIITSKPSNERKKILTEIGPEEEKIEKLKEYFKNTDRYHKICKHYLPEDVETFINQWVNYQLHTEDLTLAEEDSLELLIMYKIRIDANQKTMKEIEEKELQIKQQLIGRELDLEVNESDRWIWEMTNSLNATKQEVNKELKDLYDRYEKVQRSLNFTREQREAKRRIGGNTFLDLVRMMQDKERRKEIGDYNERMKIATQRQKDKLKRPHMFADGNYDAILLDGSDFIQKQENSNNE